MKTHAMVLALALFGCSDKGDSGGPGGDDGGDDGTTDDSTPPGPEDADNDGYDETEDCDDGDAAINPGATEVCDGVDNDCDKTTDVNASDATAYYADADGDTYGAGAATLSCDVVKDLVTNADDCDDADDAIHPGATEVCDELDTDEDCDTLADDADDSVDPKTATSMLYPDDDGDGSGAKGAKVAACDVGDGFSDNADDCDDANGAMHPFAPEVCDDGVDDDCDGVADACHFAGEIAPDATDAHLVGGTSLTLGYDATPTGDMNGDGYNDIAVATSSGNGAFVFDGPLGGTVAASDALAGFERPSSGDAVGQDVQGIGDQNGDGYDDLLISGYSVDSYTGVGYFVLGPVSGTESIDAAADATVSGDDASSYMSWYPSAGDVNGDGVIDAVLGAPGSNGNYGASYIYFGPVTSGDLGPEDAGAEFIGLVSGDWTGGCNAANGDIDGDGIDDVLISAESSDYGDSSDPYYDDGLAYLFYGPVSGSHSVKEADTRFTGGAYYSHLGWFSSLGGDNDGDGLNDVVLTAANTGDGTAYIVFGADVPGVTDYPMSKAGATVVGDAGSNQQFGYYMDSAGDLDSDGVDDLAVGSTIANGYYGMAWGYYGPISGSLEATADSSFVMYGSSTLYGMGASTVFLNDVTGDGADDLAIGAPNATVGGGTVYSAGIVFVLNGTAE
jgi:hypothetical protein